MVGTTQTPTRERRTTDRGGGLGDPWRVIVLNDNHNTFDGVAFALAAVLPGVTFDKGMSFAERIHSTGSAIVWSGHREQAARSWSPRTDHSLTMAPLDGTRPRSLARRAA